MDSDNNGVAGNWPGHSDEDLIRLAQQGALRQVWDEVWRRTEGWLVPFASQKARELGLAEADIPDAQQKAALAVLETLRRLCRPREAGRSVSRLPTLLHLVAESRIRDFARKTRTAEKRYDRTQDASTALDSSGDREESATEASPLKKLMRREDLDRVRIALAQLPAEARWVVEGRLQDKTFAQIAQELGRSEATIWRLWQGTLERLRGQLADLADWDAE